MSNQMKRKLQLRFVLLSMTALLLLQSAIVGISIYHNYRDMTRKSDLIMSQLPHSAAANARFFSVTVDPGEKTVHINQTQNVSLTPAQAATLAREALHAGKEKGFAGEYRYHIARSDAAVRILFLSRASALEMQRTASENLLWISLAGLAVMGIVLSALSGWAVRPFVELHQKQKRFITSASHELKTPLAVISADAQLLREEVGQNQWIDGILKQVDHLSCMTEDMVLLTKTEEMETVACRSAVELSRLVEEGLDACTALARSKERAVHVQLGENLSCMGDEKALCQLLSILFDNAFKYCPARGSIWVTLNRKGKGIQLCISNTTASVGTGASSLTERFARGENGHGIPGSGLGLSIAEAIVRNHGGKLTVSTPEDTVFRVCVTLP